MDDQNVKIYATVTDYSNSNTRDTGVVVEGKISKINGKQLQSPIRTIMYIQNSKMKLCPGDKITTKAKIQIPKNTSDFSEFTYYKTRYIDATAMIFADAQLNITPEKSFYIRYIPKYIAHAIESRMEDLIPSPESGFIKALVLGNTDDFYKDSQENLRIIGLSHAVAVSGMQVAFLAFVIIALVGKRRAIYVATPILFLFTLVVGSVPSVVRAFIMMTIVLIAPYIRREADGITSLTFALFVILLFNPYSACDIGLQLSFLATLGLILFGMKIDKFIMRRLAIKQVLLKRIIHFFVSIFATSIAASIFTIPLIALVFDTVSLISPIANLLLLGIINLIFLIAVIGVAASFIYMGVGKILMVPAHFLAKATLFLADKMAQLPYASVYVGNIYYVLFIVNIYVILYLMYRSRREKRAPIIPLCAVTISLIITLTCIKIPVLDYSGVQFSVLDVGQGACMLAEYQKAHIMVDCGGSRNTSAGNIAYDTMRKNGYRDLDALIITHLHTDHTNGIPNLLEKANVFNVYLPAESKDTKESNYLVDIAKRRGCQVHFVSKDTTLQFNDLSVQILHTAWTRHDNELGLAVIFQKGDFDLITTGDLGRQSEKNLVLQKNLPDAEVYIVGHHGSDTSSNLLLLNKILPEFAIISVGENNPYKHPSQQTLDLFEHMGIHLRRTDRDGTIVFWSDQVMATKEGS